MPAADVFCCTSIALYAADSDLSQIDKDSIAQSTQTGNKSAIVISHAQE
jgi:hypothetical protein